MDVQKGVTIHLLKKNNRYGKKLRFFNIRWVYTYKGEEKWNKHRVLFKRTSIFAVNAWHLYLSMYTYYVLRQ